MVGVQDQADIEVTSDLPARFLPGELPEEIAGVRQPIVRRKRLLPVSYPMPRSDHSGETRY
jgi:hypothetical protein